MKNQYINRLQEGDRVHDYFLAVRKDLRSRQDGAKFLGLAFKDKTGEIGGVAWNNAAELAKLFKQGDVVSVRGTVGSYQGKLQLRVEQITPLCETDYCADDLERTQDNTEDVIGTFTEILGSVGNPHCRALIESFLSDPVFWDQFTRASAGKKWHHEYAGGLVHHCYEMARLAQTMCSLFSDLDYDVLVTSVFLHDIGKLQEMNHAMMVEYTNAGKLLGHLQLGCDMVQRKMAAIPDFPERLRLEILHCILSHHGELVNGSPVTPRTLEAIVLHHIDNLDAQAAAFSRIIRETRERGQEWSDYLPLIDRVIWAK